MAFGVLKNLNIKFYQNSLYKTKKYYFCTVKNNKIRDHTPDFHINLWSMITKFKRFYVQENI